MELVYFFIIFFIILYQFIIWDVERALFSLCDDELASIWDHCNIKTVLVILSLSLFSVRLRAGIILQPRVCVSEPTSTGLCTQCVAP